MARMQKNPQKPKFDLFTLYEKAVMSPEADLDFMQRIFKRKRGWGARTFREDFCQTGLLATHWVKKHRDHRSWGIDLNRHALLWGRRYNFPIVGKRANQVHLCQENVLHARVPKVDIACALNFSYFIFKKRQELLKYFKAAHKGLKGQGIFFLDIMGGPDIQEEGKDKNRNGYFTYIWDQYDFNPINHDLICYIHFKLKNGKTIKKAFTYDWRLWSIPEVRDILLDAGFREVEVYWEDEDEDGEGTGTYRLRKNPESTQAWVAYIVAYR